MAVLVAVILVLITIAALLVAIRSGKGAAVSGEKELIGRRGTCMRHTGEGRAKVMVKGELWDAVCVGDIPEGSSVMVEDVRDFVIYVRADDGE